jgi:hypothetical protein
MSAITIEKARWIAARGYCHPENSHKVLDGDLCEAIAREIVKATAPPGEPAYNGTDVDVSAHACFREHMRRTDAAALEMTLGPAPDSYAANKAAVDTAVGDPVPGLAFVLDEAIGLPLGWFDALNRAGLRATEPAVDTPLEVPAK